MDTDRLVEIGWQVYFVHNDSAIWPPNS